MEGCHEDKDCILLICIFLQYFASAWHVMCSLGYVEYINGFNDGFPYFCYGNILL